jgi:hypothetical protein
VSDPKWLFFDRVVLRRWPEMSVKSAHERLNTCALVADVLEGHGRFTMSDELRESIRLAAADVKAEEGKP